MGNLVVQIIEGKMKGKHIGPRRKTYIDRIIIIKYTGVSQLYVFKVAEQREF